MGGGMTRKDFEGLEVGNRAPLDNNTDVLAVPGGWVVTVGNYTGSVSACFVPKDSIWKFAQKEAADEVLRLRDVLYKIASFANRHEGCGCFYEMAMNAVARPPK
jgi:hypothetical protein